ncbi:hypothetical protein HDR63_02550 [bacterium]|nr:hypothetical protein [bacterium]
MMLRLKIYLTALALYEIVAIMLLHCARTCDAIFGTMFCDDHAYKYFVWCVAVPLLVFLIVMWVRQIIGHSRRRRMIDQAKAAAKDLYQDVRGRVLEQVSPQDVAGLISAAVVLGIKKMSDRAGTARDAGARPATRSATRPTNAKGKK